MIIKDLFSHKIHSSGEEWPQKLIDIATVFSKFEGMPYNRQSVEDEFKKISPRASTVSNALSNNRDLSKYRDEISAYPAYLGLYKMIWEDEKWVLRMSETAKRFLLNEEPNVAAFLLLQLSLFQYPNSSGLQYSDRSAWIVHNARNRTLEFIKNGIHLSPFRLICKALLADSQINGISSFHPNISIDELSILCNDYRLNKRASPSVNSVTEVLNEIRNLQKKPIEGFERRFHLLNHTDFLQVTGGRIHLRESFSPEDSSWLIRVLNAICSLDFEFNDFDGIMDSNDLNEHARIGSWAKYFDGVTQLSSEIVQEITGEQSNSVDYNIVQTSDLDEMIPDNKAIIFRYPLRERGDLPISFEISNYHTTKQNDPEVTRIKRQKSNLTHKILMAQLDEHLRLLGAKPKENEHIDIFAEIPERGAFLFEVKSVSPENLLSQTRKGLSQLYEYRYRYKDELGKDVNLCLVYPYEPKEISWIQDYLCNDREIAVLWFEGSHLCYSQFCGETAKKLIYT